MPDEVTPELRMIAETHGTSVEMLSKHYGHLDGHAGAMAEFWAKAKAT